MLFRKKMMPKGSSYQFSSSLSPRIYNNELKDPLELYMDALYLVLFDIIIIK